MTLMYNNDFMVNTSVLHMKAGAFGQIVIVLVLGSVHMNS